MFTEPNASTDLDLWDSIVIRKDEIAAEVDRLAALPPPEDGRRRALIVHPRSTEPGLGLAPGITVSLDVLLPGERTRPIRHNSAQVNFCIKGAGISVVGDKKFEVGQHDVWTTPAMATYEHENTNDSVQVRLTYSNAALLEKLNIHVVEDDPPEETHSETTKKGIGSEPFPLGGDGAFLMSYERLINPPAVANPPLHWPWPDVKAEIDKLAALGKEYVGRRLYLLYNPATGRTNGTTHSFFATMTIRPPDIVDRPHRHTSAAINYFFSGSGWSRVGGKRYEWEAGDLMLSAPGWAIHNHASNSEPVYELTVQDQPFGLATDSLLWQEDLKRPPILLGSHEGWQTNR